MTAQTTNVATAAETTLTSSLAAGGTTINVADTSTFPAVPFYATVDPGDDAKREVVLVDSGKSSTTFTLTSATKRGQDGTSDVAHDSGAVIAVVPVAALWADINDRVDGVYSPGGTDVAVADGGTGASTAADARTNLGVAIGTDVQAHSSVLDATTASFTTADETKLDGIEAGADVTDATNVDAAGATMNTDTDVSANAWVVDEDDMVSDSATQVPTQQSVKAYVDTNSSSLHVEAKVTAGSTSVESVTWSTAFASDPVVVATVLSSTNAFATVSSRSTTGATVTSWVVGGAGASSSAVPKLVIAIGPT